MKAVPRRIANIGVLPGSPGSLPRLPRAVILALSTDKRGTPPPGDKSPFPKKTGAPNRALSYIIIYNIAGQTLRSRRTEGCPPARPQVSASITPRKRTPQLGVPTIKFTLPQATKAGEHSSPLRCVSFQFVGAICDRPLVCCLQHIFNEDAVSSLRIIYQNMGHGADQFSVLYNRTAAHECVKCRTKLFSIFSDIFLKYVEKTSMRVEEPINTT